MKLSVYSHGFAGNGVIEMPHRLLAIAICLPAFLAHPASAQDRSEAEKLALANRTCNIGKVPAANELRPIAMILVDKKNAATGVDEPTRAYVCMTAPAQMPRYKVYVNHALFGVGGQVLLAGDNSRSCSQPGDPQTGPAICRKAVRRFVTESSRLVAVCIMKTTEPPVPEPFGCTPATYKFAAKAQIFTSWQRQMNGSAIARQWLVPVKIVRVN